MKRELSSIGQKYPKPKWLMGMRIKTMWEVGGKNEFLLLGAERKSSPSPMTMMRCWAYAVSGVCRVIDGEAPAASKRLEVSMLLNLEVNIGMRYCERRDEERRRLEGGLPVKIVCT